MTDEPPEDPFRSEQLYGPLHKSFRDGEMLFLGLAELPDLLAALLAVKKLAKEDLESIVLERLYILKAGQMGPVSPDFRRWLYSESEPDPW